MLDLHMIINCIQKENYRVLNIDLSRIDTLDNLSGMAKKSNSESGMGAIPIFF